jgi:hypothetical protein
MLKKRDNNWLADRLYDIWEDYFNDVPRKNTVLIKFGKKSKRQLGCIRVASNKSRGIQKLMKEQEKNDHDSISVVTITKYFENPEIPDYVVEGTIIHELCHYAHGFNSPLQQIYDHPHKGGVIRKEMTRRGLGNLYRDCNKWLKTNWKNYIK